MGIFDFKDGCVHCLVEIGFIQALFKLYSSIIQALFKLYSSIIQALFKHYKQHTADDTFY